ncbi:hypothetical protein [Pseudodesulfovibrio senegalensis]|jgi:hypothetical protein|uniref:Polysulfide reductase NrfD n=1 Tax=Pseudodesulfovibrio senegalensis TaxID=1721087 RepID=A0A6N6N1J8_9BACT|nr:hypothetical protein [Pseudodesulfovibrio senegalensis]KAB1440369.1 hypothetical protein F8A88_14070 [Pseudodesulfovibrio senegalensis]
MDITESLTLVAQMAAPAFFDLMGLAALGAAFVATLNQLAAQNSSKAFYDKYAQQTAIMGLGLLGISMAAVAIAGTVAINRMPWLGQWLSDTSSPFMPFYASVGLGIILYIPYALLWKRFRKHKMLHTMLGAITSGSLLAGLALFVAALYIFGITTTGASSTFEVAELPLHSGSFFWPLTVQYTLFAISAAAGLSLVYLVLRRNKDDFGRDYYKFSLPLAARWALGAMLLEMASQAWLFALLSPEARTLVLQTGMGALWGGLLGFSLICCLLWLLLARSAHPMRMKWLAFVGALLLWTIHSLNCAVCLGLVSMI